MRKLHLAVYITFAIALLSLFFSVASLLISTNLSKNNNPKSYEPIACTLEAKLCPDGSYVGRNSGKQCEFDECPSISYPGEGIACTLDVKLCEDGSYVGRNSAMNCAFDPCPEDL